MLTKCPACDTTFRVTPAQLKARAGRVRCGKCSRVFNALDTLLDGAATVIDNTLTPAKTFAAETAEPSLPDQAIEQALPSAAAPEAAIEAEEPLPQHPSPPRFEAEREESSASDSMLEADADAAISEPTAQPQVETAELTDYLAGTVATPREKPLRSWPWVIASVVAVFGLLAQGIYFYRVELAVLIPDIRPLLRSACKSFQFECDVPYPRHADTLSIDASDLRPDPQQPGHLTLTATLRSKAPYAQEWPLLELTLTDVADRKLAVKDFAARDYLPRGSDIAKGFPANGEIAVSLPLDAGDLSAAGYRLYMFYP